MQTLTLNYESTRELLELSALEAAQDLAQRDLAAATCLRRFNEENGFESSLSQSVLGVDELAWAKELSEVNTGVQTHSFNELIQKLVSLED